MKGFAFFLVILVLCSVAIVKPTTKASAADLCSSRVRIPVTIKATQKLELVSHFLTFEKTRFGEVVVGELDIRNKTEKYIRSATLLATYFDEAGRTEFSIPYHAHEKGMTSTLTNIFSFYEVELDTAIAPGEILKLRGTSLLTITRFPARAEVGVIDLAFPDGGRSGFPKPWRLAPILRELPDYFEIKAEPNTLPDEILIDAQIDRRGRVGRLEILSENKPISEILEAIRKQMDEWFFFPAVDDGFEVPGKLSMLLRFHTKEVRVVSGCSFDSPGEYAPTFVEIDLVPAPDAKHRWMVYYAGFPAAGRLKGHTITIDRAVRTPRQN